VFASLGRFVLRRPWWVIGAWLVALAIIVPLAPSLSSVSNSDQTSFLPSSYESARAQRLAQREFPRQGRASSVFVVTRVAGGRLTPAQRHRVAGLVRGLRARRIAHVTAVTTSAAQRAPNGSAQLVTVSFDGPPDDQSLQDAVPSLRHAAGRLLRGSGLRAGLTGEVASAHDTTASFGSAEKIVGITTVLLIVVLLGLIFRSPLAALLPILSIGIVYGLSTAVLTLLARGVGFQVPQSLTELLIVVLFGIGTDYVLFLLFRYRERLRAGDDPRSAIVTSVRRVGQAIASSGLVVAAAMAALALSDLGSFRSMAPGFVVAVATMLLAALTLVPALIALVGPRVFWPSKRWQAPPPARWWPGVASLIARRPARTALASGGLLVALAVAVAFMHASYDRTGTLPSDTKAARADAALKSAFPPGALNPTSVYVSSRHRLSRARLGRLAGRLKGVPGVATVAPPVLNAPGTGARIALNLAVAPTSNRALDIAGGPLLATARAATSSGRQVLVGGQTMAFADVRTATRHDDTVVFPVAAVLILVILAALLRSAVAPLYLLVGVGLGFAATLGASVIAFQGLGGEAGVVFTLPMIVYLFVVAVGTDYNILLTTRLREEALAGASPRQAAALAVAHAGPTVAAAGVILAGTFGSLMLARVQLLSEIGFAVAVGIVLVALVMAAVLIPSVATLLGTRIWWPGHRAERQGSQRDRGVLAA
jgi:RND superfamily putative drug exporter